MLFHRKNEVLKISGIDRYLFSCVNLSYYLLAYLHTSVGDMIKDSSSEYDFNDGLTHALIGRRDLDLLFLKLVFHQGPTRCKQEKC